MFAGGVIQAADLLFVVESEKLSWFSNREFFDAELCVLWRVGNQNWSMHTWESGVWLR